MPEQEGQAQPQEQMPLTIFVSVASDGDIEVSTPQGQQIDLILAISLLELAKQKMVATYFQGVAQTRAQNVALKKGIEVPPVELLLPR